MDFFQGGGGLALHEVSLGLILMTCYPHPLNSYGRFFGIRVRTQLVWSIVSSMLRSSGLATSSTISPGKLTSLIAGDVFYVSGI